MKRIKQAMFVVGSLFWLTTIKAQTPSGGVIPQSFEKPAEMQGVEPSSNDKQEKTQEEVVVVGYGAQKKKAVSGAVVSINAKSMKDQPVVSFQEAIAGKLAGVQVSQNTGAPGGSMNIKVRGTAALSAGSEPLFVIDGFPVSNDLAPSADFQSRVGSLLSYSSLPYQTGVNAMSSFNPDDIESVEVLKDAASAAIYGSRGATGVVLINTKKGNKEGKMKVSYDNYFGIQEVAKTIPLQDAYQWSIGVRESRINRLMDLSTLDRAGATAMIDKFSKAGFYTMKAADLTALTNELKAAAKTGVTMPNVATLTVPPECLPYLGNSNIAGYESYKTDQPLTNTDWQKELFRRALVQNHTVSLSAGNEKTQYYFSGNYFAQDGIIKGSDFSRFSFNSNVTTQATNKLKLGVHIMPTYTVNNQISSDGYDFRDGVVMTALCMAPIFSPYNKDGSLAVNTQNTWNNTNALTTFGGSTLAYPLLPSGVTSGGSATVNTNGGFDITRAENPLALAQLIKDKTSVFRTLASTYAEYSLIKDLVIKSYVGVDVNNLQRNYFRPSTLGIPTGPVASGNPANSVGFSQGSLSLNWVWENTVRYNFTLKENHNFTALLGYSAQKVNTQNTFALGTGYGSDAVTTLNASNNNTTTYTSSTVQEWSLASAFARVNYDYQNKYFVTASLRQDGSSRFGAESQYGWFPSVSAAWSVKDEKFLENISWINALKIRASYGFTGNFNIPNYAKYSLINGSDNYSIGATGTQASGMSIAGIGNANLTWDKTQQINLGIDASFVQNKITIALDVYQSNTKNILFTVPVSLSTGFNTALVNIGEVRNRGIEFTLSTINIATKNIVWRTQANISKNMNEVMSLGVGDAPIFTNNTRGGTSYKTEVGQPIGNYYGYVVNKVIQTQAELNDYKTKYKINTNEPALGDRMYVDINGDGVIDAKDQTSLGNYQPSFIYGFTNEFSAYGFDLNIAFQGVYGSKIMNLLNSYNGNSSGGKNQFLSVYEGRYIDENQTGTGQTRFNTSPNANSNSTASSYLIEDGSFLRLRTLTLGYTLQNAWFKNKIQRLRIYVSAQNLFTVTKYSGYNPEVNLRTGNTLSPGEDSGAYPTTKTYTIGINLSL